MINFEDLSLAAQAYYIIAGLLVGEDVYEKAYEVLARLKENDPQDVSIVEGWLE